MIYQRDLDSRGKNSDGNFNSLEIQERLCAKDSALRAIQEYAEWMCSEVSLSKDPLEERSIRNLFFLMKGHREEIYRRESEERNQFFCLLVENED